MKKFALLICISLFACAAGPKYLPKLKKGQSLSIFSVEMSGSKPQKLFFDSDNGSSPTILASCPQRCLKIEQTVFEKFKPGTYALVDHMVLDHERWVRVESTPFEFTIPSDTTTYLGHWKYLEGDWEFSSRESTLSQEYPQLQATTPLVYLPKARNE